MSSALPMDFMSRRRRRRRKRKEGMSGGLHFRVVTFFFFFLRSWNKWQKNTTWYLTFCFMYVFKRTTWKEIINIHHHVLTTPNLHSMGMRSDQKQKKRENDATSITALNGKDTCWYSITSQPPTKKTPIKATSLPPQMESNQWEVLKAVTMNRSPHSLSLTHTHTHVHTYTRTQQWSFECPLCSHIVLGEFQQRFMRCGTPHTLRGSMPGGDMALDVAMEVKELGSNPLTVLQLQREHAQY